MYCIEESTYLGKYQTAPPGKQSDVQNCEHCALWKVKWGVWSGYWWSMSGWVGKWIFLLFVLLLRKTHSCLAQTKLWRLLNYLIKRIKTICKILNFIFIFLLYFGIFHKRSYYFPQPPPKALLRRADPANPAANPRIPFVACGLPKNLNTEKCI